MCVTVQRRGYWKYVPRKPSRGDVSFDPRASMGSNTTSIAIKAINLEEAISFTKR